MNAKDMMYKIVICLLPLFLMSCSVFEFNDGPAGHEGNEALQQQADVTKETSGDVDETVSKHSERIKQNTDTIRLYQDRIASLEERIRILEKKPSEPEQKKITRVKYKDPETLYAKER